MGSLDGKIAIITGGGTGMGRDAAIKFAAEGAAVVICGRRQEPIDETVGVITAAGGTALGMSVDLENPDAVNEFVATVLERCGKVDILVNNAGHSSKARSVIYVGQEEWDSVLGVNLNAVYRLCQGVIPSMIENGGGTIITISSMAALRPGLMGGAPYSAAKAAVTNLMGCVNSEFGDRGIRATAIMPAEVDTPILENRPLPPDQQARSTMMGSEDLADVMLMCAAMPMRTRIDSVVMTPTIGRDTTADLEAARKAGSGA